MNQKATNVLKQALENPEATINDEKDREFLIALLSFHPEKHQQVQDASLQAVLLEGQPTLLVNSERVSVRKCLLGLQQALFEHLDISSAAYFELTQLKEMSNFLVKLVGKYPFAAKKVNELMVEHYPH